MSKNVTGKRRSPVSRGSIAAIALALFVILDSALVLWALDAAPQGLHSDTVASSTPHDDASDTSPGAPQESALFIGDSYTTGSRASRPDAKWTSIVSMASGWKERNEGRGGTGYITTSDRRGCGRDYCPTYREVITDLTGPAPDIVVISGGRNDSEQPSSPYRDVVVSTIADAQNKWPRARIIVTSPIWDDQIPAWAPNNVNAVRAATEARGAVFVDLGQPLLNHSNYVSQDGVHPNDAGYQAIAAAFLRAIPGDSHAAAEEVVPRTLLLMIAIGSGAIIIFLVCWRLIRNRRASNIQITKR